VSAVQRYAYPQARIRARLARLATRPQLDELAASSPEAARQELARLGWEDPDRAMLGAFGQVLEMLGGSPREVVVRYRARYECENLKILLRAVERGVAYGEVAPLLHRVGALGPGPAAQEILAASSLPEAVSRLDPHPFGRALRRPLEGARRPAAERVRLEALAEREVYEAVWSALDGLDAGDRSRAAVLLGVKLDCVNLLRGLRLRRSHGLSAEEVIAYAIRGGRHLGARERAVLAHEPIDSWASQLAATPYGPALASAGTPWKLEWELARVLEAAARRELARSPFSLGLVLAYLILVELVAADARRVGEGKRLGRAASWVDAGLVTGRGR
jgi:vacuolar-type H+-ATPase subunit C/Vma6